MSNSQDPSTRMFPLLPISVSPITVPINLDITASGGFDVSYYRMSANFSASLNGGLNIRLILFSQRCSPLDQVSVYGSLSVDIIAFGYTVYSITLGPYSYDFLTPCLQPYKRDNAALPQPQKREVLVNKRLDAKWKQEFTFDRKRLRASTSVLVSDLYPYTNPVMVSNQRRTAQLLAWVSYSGQSTLNVAFHRELGEWQYLLIESPLHDRYDPYVAYTSDHNFLVVFDRTDKLSVSDPLAPTFLASFEIDSLIISCDGGGSVVGAATRITNNDFFDSLPVAASSAGTNYM